MTNSEAIARLQSANNRLLKLVDNMSDEQLQQAEEIMNQQGETISDLEKAYNDHMDLQNN